MRYRFETVDVFTETQFGGNPLAVFLDAEGLDSLQMQALAAEMNLSETTFVLPPSDPGNTARIRIFNRTAEMTFAGHPCIGTAYVIAKQTERPLTKVILEVPAGLVPVEIELRGTEVIGGKLTAPQHLTIGRSYPTNEIAECIGIGADDVLSTPHLPVAIGVGNTYVVARVAESALARCTPDVAAFRAFRARHSELGDRFSLHLYCGAGPQLRARMFAPLAGTMEDPATGSANAPLAGLLLSLGTAQYAEYTVQQGIEMGRPSLLHVTATRTGDAITSTVAGRCIPVLSGFARLVDEGATFSS